MQFFLVKLQAYTVQSIAHIPYILLEHVLKRIFWEKKSMVYQRSSTVKILRKRELTLDLVEEALKILMYLQESLFGTTFFW